MTFAEQISFAIRSAGLTVAKAAEMAGVPYRTIQNWKLGTNVPPVYVQESILAAIKNKSHK